MKTLEDGPEASSPTQKRRQTKRQEAGDWERTRGTQKGQPPPARGSGGVSRPLVGVVAPVSRERPLGGPLSLRAGRVAKEMTARSAWPRRAAGRGLERRRFRFRSLSAPVPLPPPGRPRAFHRHLASVAPRGLLLPRAPPGLRLRHGSRPAFLPLRPPASRRHGCLSLPAQHGEVLRGRGRRPAPAAALRLLRHARLARLHGGEAGAIGWPLRGGNLTEKGSGGWGPPLGRVPIGSLRPQRPSARRQRPRGRGREGAPDAWGPYAGGQWRRGLGHVGRGTFRPLTALSPSFGAILSCQPSPPGSSTV